MFVKECFSLAKIKNPKNNKPVLAICYDFDKTLSPDDMQAQGFIQAVYDGDVKAFWDESNALAKTHEMDTNLAYMYKMVEESHGRIVFTRKTLEDYGAKVELFPGVEEWFDRIRRYGVEHDVIVEHYIISSGLKEMIEGTSIAKAGVFEKIYASSFMFDEKDVAIWPAQAINYTNKTQFLFRIEKGTLDINDRAVNDYFSPSKIRVPFRNIVYIGDSETDIPCMKLVNSYGGHSIGVYNPKTKDKSRVYKMISDNRIKYFAPADYSEKSDLDILLKNIIKKTSANEELEQLHYRQEDETENYYTSSSEESIRKAELIDELDDSRNFQITHDVIKKLKAFKNWDESEVEKLISIALNNHPVRYILTDSDVKRFYKSVIKNVVKETNEIKELTKLLNG